MPPNSAGDPLSKSVDLPIGCVILTGRSPSASEVADTIVRRTGEEIVSSQSDSMIFPSMSESYEYYSLKDLAGTLLA
jgi:hypothetical protein